MTEKSKPSGKPEQTGNSQAGQRAAEDWQVHEHVSEAVSKDASHLVEQTGSPELAKHAIDTVQKREQQPPADKDDFAAQLGFASYLEMFEASSTVSGKDGESWLITPSDNGKWIAWNEQHLQLDNTFDSKGEAEAFVRERTQERS